MGLVDYELSSSSDEEEVKQLKQPSHPPTVMTSTSKKPPTKKGEKRQLTANFFLPPKIQAALLAGDISSDSDDDDVGAKISVKQRDGEKGLLDILPAPSSSTCKGRGGGLGEAAAIIAAARNKKKAKESCVIDTVVEEEDDEEEEGQQQDDDIIACVKEDIGLKGKVKKSNLMSQAASVVEDPTNFQYKQQPHDHIPISTSTITPWSSSHSAAVYAATEEVPAVRNEILTSCTTVQPSVPAYYNNQCHQQEDTIWGSNSQGGNSRPRKNKVS